MALPIIAAIGQIVKGVVGLIKQFGIPLAAFFAGKKSQELKRLKREAKNAKESSKIKDGISRSNDSDLDDILHD